MAMAHEIGHLLLGTSAHASTGLMRAIWSRDELHRHDPADWQFSSVESATMIRALRDREFQVASNIDWGK
jgi:hypothetical protein